MQFPGLQCRSIINVDVRACSVIAMSLHVHTYTLAADDLDDDLDGW